MTRCQVTSPLAPSELVRVHVNSFGPYLVMSRFCSVPARFANVQAYFELRADALKTRTTAAWIEIFDRLDVPAMPYHTFEIPPVVK